MFEQTMDQSPLKRAGSNWVFIYKAVTETLTTSTGLFKIIPNSHKMTAEQLLQAARKDISVRTDQALIIDGRLVIDWPTTGGGICLLKMVEIQEY